jgi:hypothetical protein
MGERHRQYGATRNLLSASSSTIASRGSGSPQDISHVLSNLNLNSEPTSPFDNLAPSEYLLLLTPYLHAPPPHHARLAVAMDPFEPFGRRLAGHHANIRHVPYVAKHGMVEVHEQLLDDAGGVIVIICQPPDMKGVSSKQRLDGLKYQERFAKEVAKYLENELGDEVPNVIVTIDAGSFKDAKKFDAAFELDDWEDLEDTADEVFGES